MSRRREWLAGAAALVGATALPAVAMPMVSHPDAAIFALRDRCARLQRRSEAYDTAAEAEPLGSAKRQWLRQRTYATVSIWHAAKWELGQLPACTVEGMRAKAEILWHVTDPGEGYAPTDDTVLAWSLCRDLLGQTHRSV